jgi:hypothetical protein
MKLARIIFVLAIGVLSLLGKISWAETKDVEKKSRHSIQCSTEYFKEYEHLAKKEVVTYRLGKRYRANLIEFISLLHQNKKDAEQFCDYTSNDYLALLWSSTNTLKLIRDKQGPFLPDTFGALAESRLNRLWSDGFKLGWNEFPKDPKQLQCLQRKSVLQTLKECEKLNPSFFIAIRAKKMPKGW